MSQNHVANTRPEVPRSSERIVIHSRDKNRPEAKWQLVHAGVGLSTFAEAREWVRQCRHDDRKLSWVVEHLPLNYRIQRQTVTEEEYL